MDIHIKSTPTRRPLPQLASAHPIRPARGEAASPDFFVGLTIATPIGLALWAIIVWSVWWLATR